MKVEESDNATFKCVFSNPSFEIHWKVNGSDAEFKEFRDKGIAINPQNISELIVLGHKSNNHTLVQCLVFISRNHRIVSSVSSNTATLIVISKCIII